MTFKQLRRKRKHHRELISNTPQFAKHLPDLDKIERELRDKRREKIVRFLRIVSNIILWICAVGGFVLAILAYIKE